MSLETKHFYEFSDFRLDVAEKVLRRDGKPVSLTPKAFHLLEILVENHGHIVEKQKLLSEIWADSFVEEGNLTFNIRILRKSLNDDARQPRFIETVSRRGYRFIAEVDETFGDIVKNPPVLQASPAQQPYLKKSYLNFALIVILLLGTIATASWLVQKRFVRAETNAPLLTAAFHSEKISNSGKVKGAAISPDGKLVVYPDVTGDKFGVWLRHLTTSENTLLIPPSDDYYFGFAFAHDGQTVYFVRRQKDAAKYADIYRISIFGGVPEKIVERTEGWISLSPDDRQISFVRCENRDDDFCSLYVAATDGQNERKLTTRPRPERLTDNQFSPDGKSIAFAAGESFNGASDFRLMKIDLASGAESKISLQGFFEIKSLKWLPDGENLLAAVKENLTGKTNILQFSAINGESRPLTKDAANYNDISLDKNAEQMIATQTDNNFQLVLSQNGVSRTLTNAREAVFAPGGQIIYSTDGHLWSIDRDGGRQHQLTSSFKDFIPYVGPDGHFIYFTSNRTGANQIWRMNMDGGEQLQITKNEGGYPVFATADGKLLYYESGLHQTLRAVPADGSGGEFEVSGQILFHPAFSLDGALVAYFFRDRDGRRKFAVMKIADQKIIKTFEFPEATAGLVQIRWLNDNRTFEYISGGDSQSTLWSQSLDEKNPRVVANLGDREIAYFSVAPDDNSFVLTRGEWLSDAVLIDGLK